uniref:Uncharacterized protein n=1 Tax=Spermophilus dauricus TaxID=99837 RepID=A0A8C9UKR4_SPEDA
MATSCLPPMMLKLKQFMRRQQVLRLSRRILQEIWQVSNVSDHKYLKNWRFRIESDRTQFQVKSFLPLFKQNTSRGRKL